VSDDCIGPFKAGVSSWWVVGSNESGIFQLAPLTPPSSLWCDRVLKRLKTPNKTSAVVVEVRSG
jgi:hypothetical protein